MSPKLLRSIVFCLSFAAASAGCKPEVEGSNAQVALKLIRAVEKEDRAEIKFLTFLPAAGQENLRYLDPEGCFLRRIQSYDEYAYVEQGARPSYNVLASWKCPMKAHDIRTVSFLIKENKVVTIDPAIYE